MYRTNSSSFLKHGFYSDRSRHYITCLDFRKKNWQNFLLIFNEMEILAQGKGFLKWDLVRVNFTFYMYVFESTKMIYIYLLT